jgi:branched-chain amino acid transport system permease protein
MAPHSLNTDSAAQSQPAATRPAALALLGKVAGVAIPLILVAIFLPELLSAFWLRAFTSAAIFALAAAGVALLYGRLGLVSLAQVALLGVGAWASLRLSHGTGLPFEVILLGGGIAAGLVGLLVGLPALRMRGLYLALITLMAAGAFQVIVGGTGFPDGGSGFLGRVTSASARQLMARPWLAQSDPAYFRYVLVVVAIGFLLVALHRRTQPGRAWALIRKSEACALSAGVNVTRYKTWAFTLAGFLAGIAGGLLAGSVGQLDGRNFPASDSILLFALTVVGGAYSWLGPVITGLLFRAFPSLLISWGVDGNLAYIVFGAALLHALITAPAGVAGQLSDLAAGLRARFKRQNKEPDE